MREYKEIYHSEPISIESLASWIGEKCPDDKFEEQIRFSNFENRDMNKFDDKILEHLKVGLIDKSTLRDFVNSGILEVEVVQKKWSIRHAADELIRIFVIVFSFVTGLFIFLLVITSNIESKNLALCFSTSVSILFIHLLWKKAGQLRIDYIRKDGDDNIYYKFRWTERGNKLFQNLELEKPAVQFDPSYIN